jgi:hypothetical protein
MSRWAIRLAIYATIIGALAAVLAVEARAYHESTGWRTHYTGTLTSNEARNYGPVCGIAINWSAITWQVNGGYGMARIIQHSNGAVIAVAENQGGQAGVGHALYDDYTSWKANCRNSTPWQITHYGVTCEYKALYSHGQCV